MLKFFFGIEKSRNGVGSGAGSISQRYGWIRTKMSWILVQPLKMDIMIVYGIQFV
jgi:hypothetical protein